MQLVLVLVLWILIVELCEGKFFSATKNDPFIKNRTRRNDDEQASELRLGDSESLVVVASLLRRIYLVMIPPCY